MTLHWAPTTECCHQQPLDAYPAHVFRRTMERFCRVLCSGVITPDSPAVNNRRTEDTHGAVDSVPCIYLPGWWPEQQFIGRPNQSVRLSDGGRSTTEHRVSHSRTEVVAVRRLSVIEQATSVVMKALEKLPGESGAATDGIKSLRVQRCADE